MVGELSRVMCDKDVDESGESCGGGSDRAAERGGSSIKQVNSVKSGWFTTKVVTVDSRRVGGARQLKHKRNRGEGTRKKRVLHDERS